MPDLIFFIILENANRLKIKRAKKITQTDTGLNNFLKNLSSYSKTHTNPKIFLILTDKNVG